MNNNTKILINDLDLQMSIGIHVQEKAAPQRVLVSVEADISPPPSNDDIDTTLDYEALVNAITALATSRHFNLAETFAEDIAAFCLQDPRVTSACVRVEKPDIIENTKSVGVEITRSR